MIPHHTDVLPACGFESAIRSQPFPELPLSIHSVMSILVHLVMSTLVHLVMSTLVHLVMSNLVHLVMSYFLFLGSKVRPLASIILLSLVGKAAQVFLTCSFVSILAQVSLTVFCRAPTLE